MSRIVEGPVGTAMVVALCTFGLWPLAAFITLFIDAPSFEDPWTYRLVVHSWAYPAYLLVALAMGVYLRLAKPEFRRGWGLVLLPLLVFIAVAVSLGALSQRYRDSEALSPGEHALFSACRVVMAASSGSSRAPIGHRPSSSSPCRRELRRARRSRLPEERRVEHLAREVLAQGPMGATLNRWREAGKLPGRATLDDLLAIPEEVRRHELIDGEIVEK